MFLDTAVCDKKIGNKTRVRSRLVSSQYVCKGFLCVFVVVATSFGRENMSNFCIYSECNG